MTTASSRSCCGSSASCWRAPARCRRWRQRPRISDARGAPQVGPIARRSGKMSPALQARQIGGVAVGEPVRVGMLGCGAVGTGVARLIREHAGELRDRTGTPIELRRVAVRDLRKQRDASVDPAWLTDDPMAVVTDPEIDLVVEVMGGIEPARSLMIEAFRLGKPVVTA